MKRFRPEAGYPIDLGGGWRAALEMDDENLGWVFFNQNGTTWGAIPVDRRRSYKDPILGEVWHLVSSDPLTLKPSVHLVGIVHDFITAGRWQSGGAPG